MGRSGPGQRAGRGPGEPGGDLLFRVLRRSTIGAEGFHGRVRDGIGCWAPRCGHQAVPAPAGWLWGWDGSPRRAARRHRGRPRGAGLGNLRRRARRREVSSGASWRAVPSSGGAVMGQGVAGRGLPLHAGGGPVFLQSRSFSKDRERSGLCLRRSGSSGFERLVPVSSTGCPASTPGLSTWWSSTALDETWF